LTTWLAAYAAAFLASRSLRFSIDEEFKLPFFQFGDLAADEIIFISLYSISAAVISISSYLSASYNSFWAMSPLFGLLLKEEYLLD
jgi:hypothetical protein